jgi:hypothetical protein
MIVCLTVQLIFMPMDTFINAFDNIFYLNVTQFYVN